MRFVINLLVSGLSVALAAYLIPSVTVDGFGTAILVAVALAVINATLGFVLRLIALPLTIITLGLFSFIISVLMVLVTDYLIGGFNIGGFLGAALFAIILSIIQMLVGYEEEPK